MKYFKFEIPSIDGQPVKYGKGWHGTMPKCPKNVEVLLYNDAGGYGYAKTISTSLPPEVEEIDEATVLKEVEKYLKKFKAGVFAGSQIEDRLDWLPEVVVKEVEILPDWAKDLPEEQQDIAVKVKKQARFCPVCGEFLGYGGQTEKRVLKKCSQDHKLAGFEEVSNGR